MATLANTAGTRFLRSILEHNAASLFRSNSDPSLYLEDERPAAQKISAHIAAYGTLPSFHSLQIDGVSFPPNDSPQEPPAFHAAQMRRRAAYNLINSRFPALSQAVKGKEIEEAVAIMREILSEASGKIEAANYSSLLVEAEGVLSGYQFAKQHAGMLGVPMRWQTLNDATNGAQGGDLIVVAGRPGTGKTYTLMELAVDAQRHGRSSGLASLEMGLPQIARRWIGCMTGINPNSIRDGAVAHWSESRMDEAVAKLATSAPVHLFRGDMRKSVDGIASLMDEFDPEIMFVDAAYLLSPSGRKQGFVSRWEAISEVIRELKQLALHKNRPVVITVQFNRNQRDRPRKGSKEEGPFPVPDLGDVAGTDSIPQDASILLGQTLWPAPFAKTRRAIHGMKNREGETFAFGINFNFNPVNFDEIPLVLESSGESLVDTSWML